MLIRMTTAGAEAPRSAGTAGPSAVLVDARREDLPRPSAMDTRADHANPRGCPFLVAAAGGWRLDMPSRDHRCGAVSPPAPLAPEKQGRLCLTPTHPGCATYIASQSARAERIGAAPVRRATRWGLARTTSVIEDPGGIRARLLAALLDRRRWPAIPAVALVATLFVLGLSGLRGGVPSSPVATASPGRPAVNPAPTAVVAGTTPTPAPLPSPQTTTRPATPRPSASLRSYRVESGDTLSAIANRFDVSVAALVSLNDIDDPGALQIGQVLLIP